MHGRRRGLAEDGVAEFLDGLRAPLARLGVELPQDVAIADTDLDRWAQAAIDTFDAVNAALTAAGSEERLYALYGGNDLYALLLTDALRAHLHATEKPSDRPYLLRADDPEGERQRR